MLDQHKDVLDLYHALGIVDANEVKTTFSNSPLYGWSLSDCPSKEQVNESNNKYSFINFNRASVSPPPRNAEDNISI